ncbi:putative cell division protein [Rhizobium etli CIAT 652]|uniref:Putative cell division protein n=1 Tax=Rhizobium etli (strain CIAT 652) TaxID=491916 RepID=B3Q0H8_RHIE6|nr:putative cell division protein [Rhizobium etli CIAT 652]
MSNPKSLKEGHGLPEYVAYANIRSGIRPFLRADRYSIAIVRPTGTDGGAYQSAARVIVGSRRFESNRVVDFSKERPNLALGLAFEAMRHPKSILLFADMASVPDHVRMAVDLLVELKPPTIELMKGIFQWRDKVAITDKQAEIFLLLDDDMKRAIARPGRNVGRMLAQLVMRPRDREPQPRSVPVEPATNDFEYRLETMPGYGEAKDWGMQLSDDLAGWKAGRIPWSDVDTGLLLSGPSGVGKTIYARALAKTCDVELVVASAARWQSKGHLGDMQRAMFKSFDDAKKKAPAILFIDEVDSFTDRDREQSHNASYVRQVINSFLECLDGTAGREGVVVVGACNNPTVMDAAILRPGRLDHHIRLGYPDAEARVGILRLHLRGDLPDADFSQFADDSFGLTGADIARLVRLARRVARRHRRAVTVEDVMASLPGRVVLSEKFRWALAIHELGHAAVAVATGARKVWAVSVESKASVSVERQILGGAVMEASEFENHGKQFYLDNIAIHLGGMAAEQVFLAEHGDGVASDLDGATRLAIILDRHLGMNGVLNAWPAGVDERLIDSVRRIDGPLLERIEPVLQEQLARAKTIIESHRTSLEGLWLELIGGGHLTGKQIVDGLKPDDATDLPTPKTRRKIRQRLHG